MLTLVTLYLQNTLRRSPLEAAATLLPFSLAVIGGASLSAALLRRYRLQLVVALGLTAIAAADLALIPSAAAPLAVAASLPSGSPLMRSIASLRLGSSASV
jgi:hypothetical protein